MRPTVPIAAAEIAGPKVTFRELSTGTLNSANSPLPVAADEGLWRRSKGLPIGSRIRLKVSDASLPADGHSAVHLTVSLFDRDGRPVTHVIKVDKTTLPAGSRLVVLSSRNAGDGDSLFADLRDGELHRADFAEGSCTDKVMQDVKRRQLPATLAPVPPAGREHTGIEFESRDPPGTSHPAAAESRP